MIGDWGGRPFRSGPELSIRSIRSSSSGGASGKNCRNRRGRSCLRAAKRLGDVVLLRERRLSGQQPKQRRPEAVNVRGRTDGRRVDALLRRHEFEAAEQRPRIGSVGMHLPGQAEIDELDLAVGGEQEIGRFQVAVDKMPVVRLLQTAGGLSGPFARLGDRGRSVAADQFLEIAAGNQLHDEIVQGRLVRGRRRDSAGVVGQDDVRMPQLGKESHFGVEPFQHVGRELLVHGDDFDRHPPAEQGVLAEQDDAHAAFAEPVQDAIWTEDQAVGIAANDGVPQLVFGQVARPGRVLRRRLGIGEFGQAIAAL